MPPITVERKLIFFKSVFPCYLSHLDTVKCSEHCASYFYSFDNFTFNGDFATNIDPRCTMYYILFTIADQAKTPPNNFPLTRKWRPVAGFKSKK